MKSTTAEPTLFGFPLNRIVAFLGPHISWLAGLLATWLVVHVHFLGLFHVTGSRIAYVLAQLGTFAVVTLVTWLGHQKWLDGFQRWAYGVIGSTPLAGELAATEHVSQSDVYNYGLSEPTAPDADLGAPGPPASPPPGPAGR